MVVTEADSGLGRGAARSLTRRNANKVIITSRDLAKGEAAKASIETSTGRRNIVEVWQLDPSSYESVKKYAKRAEGLQRLDVLPENAGIDTTQPAKMEGNESRSW
jgi:retinol dehydrogenase-12